MVSPRAPIGKRVGPSEQEGKGGVGQEYVDPFEQYNERAEVRSEGWISWAGSGVMRGLEGASNVVMNTAAGYSRRVCQQDIPLEVSQGGSSLDFHDINEGYDVREEGRLVRNALAAFRNAEARGDSNVEITEAEHAAWKRWEAREAEIRRIEGEHMQRERELDHRKKAASRGAPGILLPGQGFVPVGETPAPVSSTHSQNVPFPQPSIPKSLIPGAGRSTSSFHSTSSTIPARRNVGATPRATDSGSDSDVCSMTTTTPFGLAEQRNLWG
ncbi:hypothetical protein L211DRAFT_848687 [Terfezia boudieri ATCC MYA-4762]|uniref:Uncharacterized protein n=1 Tax=Terfezia boudieri ATCC MYA-4762 TaxID=1051890 RepID=A0A3N4LPW6_9PEZI|nr:hypothetical protein L211DRAFT_848687 [Terfezia boudieri ATCC MYA-4762]